MKDVSFIPEDGPTPVRSEGPIASDPATDCFQCGRPLQFPGELVCNECAEEILQSETRP
jgi:hypothetical protein